MGLRYEMKQQAPVGTWQQFEKSGNIYQGVIVKNSFTDNDHNGVAEDAVVVLESKDGQGNVWRHTIPMASCYDFVHSKIVKPAPKSAKEVPQKATEAGDEPKQNPDVDPNLVLDEDLDEEDGKQFGAELARKTIGVRPIVPEPD